MKKSRYNSLDVRNSTNGVFHDNSVVLLFITTVFFNFSMRTLPDMHLKNIEKVNH